MDNQKATSGRIFRIGLVTPLEKLAPHQGINFAHMSTMWQIYEPAYRSTMHSEQIEPVLLDYPLQKEANIGGPTTYSAAVRPGHYFSDGTELRAEHIATSLQKTPSFAAQASTTAQSGRVFFTLKRPNANFQFALARHDHPIALERGSEFIGTGPYMLGPNPTPECFRLLRNPYYKESTGPAEVECRIYPLDPDGGHRKLLYAVQRGEVDFTEELPRKQLDSVENMKKFIDLGFCTAILFFNTEKPLFSDPRVRLAFSHAINRKTLAGQSYSNALAFAASGLLPPSLGSTPDGIMTDLPRARELLAQANVKPTAVPLSLWVVPVPRPHLPQPRATAQMIADQLGQLGFTIEIGQARTVADFYEIGGRGTYDLLLSGWIPDSVDPLEFMEAVLASYNIPSGMAGGISGANYSRWRSPAIDEAIRNQRAAPNLETWKTICNMVVKETPFLPLMYGPRICIVSWRVKKFPRNFTNRPFLAEIEF
jgi:peptide/nickel transport system substrate-binding protein